MNRKAFKARWGRYLPWPTARHPTTKEAFVEVVDVVVQSNDQPLRHSGCFVGWLPGHTTATATFRTKRGDTATGILPLLRGKTWLWYHWEYVADWLPGVRISVFQNEAVTSQALARLLTRAKSAIPAQSRHESHRRSARKKASASKTRTRMSRSAKRDSVSARVPRRAATAP